MENSYILKVLIHWWDALRHAFLQSKTHSLFHCVYHFLSSFWNRSSFVAWLTKERNYQKNFIQRLFLKGGAWIRKKAEIFAKKQWISSSLSGRLAKGFLHSFLAGNTTFFCILLCSLGISYSLCFLLLNGQRFSPVVLLLLIAAVLLLHFKNRNLSPELEDSWFIHQIEKTFEVSFHFRWFSPAVAGNFFGLVAAVIVGLFAGIGFYFSALLGCAIILAIFGCLLILAHPLVGVYAAVAVAPFFPTFGVAAIIGLTLVSLLLYALRHPDFHLRMDGAACGVFLFFLLGFISALFSVSRETSFPVWSMTCLLTCIYLLIINTVRTKEHAIYLLKLFVFCGMLVALYGIGQYFFSWGDTMVNAWLDEEMFTETTIRVYSTLNNPNVLGEYLLLVGFAALGIVWTSQSYRSKLVYAAMLFAIFICLLMTQSRGCWLGCILGVAIFITFVNGRLWGLLPFALILAPFVLPSSIITRFTSIGNLQDTSSSYRVFIWLGTLQLLRDFWFSGIGMGEGAFNAVYPYYSYNAIVAPHSHNIYLQLLIDGGILHLSMFLIIIVFCMKRFCHIYRRFGKSSTPATLIVSIGAAVAAFLLEGVFDYVFYNYRVMMLFWALLAIGMSFYAIHKEETA